MEPTTGKHRKAPDTVHIRVSRFVVVYGGHIVSLIGLHAGAIYMLTVIPLPGITH